MITCKQITKENHSCDNCNREMPLIINYKFIDKRIQGNSAYLQLYLCEDCSNALANLHYKVMVSGVDHKYDLDEITEF